MPSTNTLEAPPFYGFVETTVDALCVIQAARSGLIPRMTRRLNDLERRTMIKSGAVFVFNVEESGIHRWTDGYSWSPSRISGNFLIYRETGEQNRYRMSSGSDASQSSQRSSGHGSATRSGGLIKKTITVKIEGSDYHLISYYTQEDVQSMRLRRPTSFSELTRIEISHELIQDNNFRYPPKIETARGGRLAWIRDSNEVEEGAHVAGPSGEVRTASGGEPAGHFSRQALSPTGFLQRNDYRRPEYPYASPDPTSAQIAPAFYDQMSQANMSQAVASAAWHSPTHSPTMSSSMTTRVHPRGPDFQADRGISHLTATQEPDWDTRGHRGSPPKGRSSLDIPVDTSRQAHGTTWSPVRQTLSDHSLSSAITLSPSNNHPTPGEAMDNAGPYAYRDPSQG